MNINLEALERDGVVGVDGFAHTSELLRHLDARPQFHGHVKQGGAPVQSDSEVTCWGMDDVLLAPYFLEWILGFTQTAGEYLGAPPLLYSVNAFATHPSSAPLNVDVQEFHRDKDDIKFLALFVYLTDVHVPYAGVHQFQSGTHLGTSDGPIREVYGSVGTAFLADTRGLHRGLRPLDRRRVLAWARWGVSDPPASYVWDGLGPIEASALGNRYPKDARLRESIRLVAR